MTSADQSPQATGGQERPAQPGQGVATVADRARDRPLAALLVAATAAVALFAYTPVLLWLWDSWISNPYYSHGLLVVPLAGYVAWRRRDAFTQAPRQGQVHDLDVLWLVAAGALFIAGRYVSSNHIQAWSLLPLLVGALLLSQGRARTKAMAWPLGILVLVVPIPFVEGFFGPLQLVATAGSATLAGLAGVNVTWDAVSLTVDGITFAVVPLCAGLSSTISLIAVTAVGFLFWPASLLMRTVVYALVVPVALVANMARISSTVYLAHRSGADQALAFFHGPGAIVLYLIALGGVGALIWAARRIDDKRGVLEDLGDEGKGGVAA